LSKISACREAGHSSKRYFSSLRPIPIVNKGCVAKTILSAKPNQSPISFGRLFSFQPEDFPDELNLPKDIPFGQPPHLAFPDHVQNLCSLESSARRHRTIESLGWHSLAAWRQGAKHFWCGDRNQGNVWQVPKPRVNDLHPTMKPIELVERAIRNSSQEGDVVLDPFAGSGSTLIACQRTGRSARLIELEPQYVDVIVRRWQEFTGRSATLEGHGGTFAEVAHERLRKAA
jgi:hypothetical protein